MTLSRHTRKILTFILPTLIIVGGFTLLYDASLVLANNAPAPAAETENTAIARVLWWVVATVFGGLTWLTGMLLDFAIVELVLNFGVLFKDSGLGVAVNQLWSVVRDIFNLTFIFGLIYIGFRLVLDSESSSARKAIVNLIIAALLVNFSLFITKTVIDFSNIAAVQVAGLIYSGNAIPAARGGAVEPNSPPSISLAFGNQMGLSNLWGMSSSEGGAPPPGGLLYIFGAMILFMVAAFSFLVGFVMLASRFITLNFMMILSPIMFLGMVFSSLNSYSKDYWNKFLKNCFFAPAFLLMLYFALYILGTFTEMIRNGGSAAAALSNGSSVSAIAGMLLGGGFLIGSVLVAQKMSMAGSSTMIKFGNSMVGKARGMATGAAIGTGRFAGRSTVGVAAQGVGYGAKKLSAGLNNSLGRLAQSENKWARRTARTLDRTVGAGLKAAEKTTAFGSETAEARDKRVREQQARFNTSVQEERRGGVTEAQLAVIGANGGDTPLARRTRSDASNLIAAQVRRMSNDEVLDLDHTILENPEFARHLTDAHITALRASGVYTNDQATNISNARDTGTFTEIENTLGSTNTSAAELNTALDQLTQTVQRIPIDRLQGFPVTPADGEGVFPPNSLLNPRIASSLTDKQLDDLQNSGRLNAGQMQQVRDARTGAITAIASGNAPGIINTDNEHHANVIGQRRAAMMQGSSQDAGRLPAAVFSNEEMAQYITPTALQQRVRNGLTQAEVTAIDTNISNYITLDTTPDSVTNMWTRWSANTTEGARFTF